MRHNLGRVTLAVAAVAAVFSAPMFWSALSPAVPGTAATRLRATAGSGGTPSSTGSPAVAATAAPRGAPTSVEPVRVARPTRVVIPDIDVDARLTAVGLNDDGSMEVPEFGLAGWYELGPRPGEAGPAVIVAHVDSYEGPDVFHRLRELSRGDEIEVRYRDGTSSRFVVHAREQQLKQELPTARIWNETRRPVLRLVTCGGDFDTTERTYLSNVIVYASSV